MISAIPVKLTPDFAKKEVRRAEARIYPWSPDINKDSASYLENRALVYSNVRKLL